MASPPGEHPEVARIDAQLAAWRQGDVVLGPVPFVHIGDPRTPLTSLSSEATGDEPMVLVGDVPGLVVLTQTCDLVRSCVERPFVEVAPLFEVEEADLRQIDRGYRPKYACVPAIMEKRLVADLDRIMTVEKSVVTEWKRVPGCRTDAEARTFAEALKRKRGRFAFPDEFVERVVPELQKRLRDKHDKASDEGRALRALREIRITAKPSWEADRVSLFFWFIRESGQPDFEGKPWDHWRTGWLKLVKTTERYEGPHEGIVTLLADMSALEYVESDPLDLDYLSLRGHHAG